MEGRSGAARKKRELEEARKSGLIPAERDEEGREINPHIPQYIAKAPWYLSNEGPSLKHQRRSDANESGESKPRWYQRGVLEDPQIGKKRFKKGACENCGALTHKSIDCVDRPRQVGAKWKGKQMAPDELIPDQNVEGFEAKRDRWGGYEAEDFELNMEEFVRDEKERASKDSLKIEEFDLGTATVGTKDDRTRTTTRNLRIREDTAKYLMNLDLNSAFYDPKTRSMREDPTQGLQEDLREKLNFRGDNAIRNTGDAALPSRMEVFAWESYAKGNRINVQTNPTAVDLEFRKNRSRAEAAKVESRERLLAKYGGKEHLQLPEDESAT